MFRWFIRGKALASGVLIGSPCINHHVSDLSVWVVISCASTSFDRYAEIQGSGDVMTLYVTRRTKRLCNARCRCRQLVDLWFRGCHGAASRILHYGLSARFDIGVGAWSARCLFRHVRLARSLCGEKSCPQVCGSSFAQFEQIFNSLLSGEGSTGWDLSCCAL